MSEKRGKHVSRAVIARRPGERSRSSVSLPLPFFLFFFLFWWSCDVHEWPGAGERRLYRLRLEFDTLMTRVEAPYQSKSAGERATHQVRHVVRVFPVGADGTVSRVPSLERVETGPWTGKPDREIELELPSGRHKILVWSDIVPVGTTGDHHHATGDFTAITLREPHAGNTLTRDAFRGIEEVEVTPTMKEGQPVEVVVSMERPLARFEFITTDLREFVDKEVESAKAKAEAKALAGARAKAKTRSQAGEENPAVLADTTGSGKSSETVGAGENQVLEDESKISKIDISDYKVVFVYSGFMPHVFDLFRDKPVGSRNPGTVSFASTITRLNDGEASIGFDHVLVNGHESSGQIASQLYDREGNLLSTSGSITVPVKRGQHTVMKGKFLTREASGGVSIDPGFVDEFNVRVY